MKFLLPLLKPGWVENKVLKEGFLSKTGTETRPFDRKKLVYICHKDNHSQGEILADFFKLEKKVSMLMRNVSLLFRKVCASCFLGMPLAQFQVLQKCLLTFQHSANIKPLKH